MSRLIPTARRLLLCSLLLAASRVEAQTTFAVRPVQNLAFGALLPGVPTTVDPLQLTQSGQIEVKASIGAIFEILYTLPSAMTSGSNTLPLSFLNTSGGAAASPTPSSVIRFDPRFPKSFQYVTTDRATFFLGGRASPRIGQPTGSYSAPVIVTITNLGV